MFGSVRGCNDAPAHRRAEVVEDDAEWLVAYRALIGSFGLVGRLVDGDADALDDAALLATHRVVAALASVARQQRRPRPARS